MIEAYPVLVLTNKWPEGLFWPQCACMRWCHVERLNSRLQIARWASHNLWQQVAHVDTKKANPSVSEYTRRAARRASHKRRDSKLVIEPS